MSLKLGAALGLSVSRLCWRSRHQRACFCRISCVRVSVHVCMSVRAPVHDACEGRADVSTRGRNRKEDCAVLLLQHLGHLLYN